MDRKFPPRDGDLPRAELMKLAEKALYFHGGPGLAMVKFKFTCPFCGTRCTFEDANLLYENGTCFHCGQTAPVEFGGLALELRLR